MIIRPAVEKDHAELSQIMRQSIRIGCRDAYGADVVDAWTADGNTVFPFDIPERTFAGEIDGRLVGFCSWVPQADDAAVPKSSDLPVAPETGYARINRMFILPKTFGRGIGRRLLAITEGAARKDNFHRFVLWSSLNAIPFYKIAGYQESGEEVVSLTENHQGLTIKMIKKD